MVMTAGAVRVAVSFAVAWPKAPRVYLKGIGYVRVHQHRTVKGRVKTVTVKREGKYWHVVLSCDEVPAEPLEPTGSAVGIACGHQAHADINAARKILRAGLALQEAQIVT